MLSAIYAEALMPSVIYAKCHKTGFCAESHYAEFRCPECCVAVQAPLPQVNKDVLKD